jgi:hypothetical protein
MAGRTSLEWMISTDPTTSPIFSNEIENTLTSTEKSAPTTKATAPEYESELILLHNN